MHVEFLRPRCRSFRLVLLLRRDSKVCSNSIRSLHAVTSGLCSVMPTAFCSEDGCGSVSQVTLQPGFEAGGIPEGIAYGGTSLAIERDMWLRSGEIRQSNTSEHMLHKGLCPRHCHEAGEIQSKFEFRLTVVFCSAVAVEQKVTL